MSFIYWSKVQLSAAPLVGWGIRRCHPREAQRAESGIQKIQLDSRLRGNDKKMAQKKPLTINQRLKIFGGSKKTILHFLYLFFAKNASFKKAHQKSIELYSLFEISLR